MKPINWNVAHDAFGGPYCGGLRNDETYEDANDPGRVLECHETDVPVEFWCNDCIGWIAVCELAAQQVKP